MSSIQLLGGNLSCWEPEGKFCPLSWAGEPLSTQPGSPKLVSPGGNMVYMEKVQLLDQGTYTCECRNAAGSSSKEHHLEVHGEQGGTDTCGVGGGVVTPQCKVQLDPKAIP